ncbi:MAG: clostripain-related cysteine peptidase [Gallintestinimicrobium sp.]
MNGSDLESEDGEATEDLCEMLAANISSQVNVLVETIGTKAGQKAWNCLRSHAALKAEAGNLVLVMTASASWIVHRRIRLLIYFLGRRKLSASRYILIFWDHGAGPVYGFGYDEHQSEDSVLIDEIQTAIRQAVYFDIIGMDSCIMSSLELCCAMYNYCDYMILSEDFESGYGWSYTGWLNALSENTSISSESLGKSSWMT